MENRVTKLGPDKKNWLGNQHHILTLVAEIT